MISSDICINICALCRKPPTTSLLFMIIWLMQDLSQNIHCEILRKQCRKSLKDISFDKIDYKTGSLFWDYLSHTMTIRVTISKWLEILLRITMAKRQLNYIEISKILWPCDWHCFSLFCQIYIVYNEVVKWEVDR